MSPLNPKTFCKPFGVREDLSLKMPHISNARFSSKWTVSRWPWARDQHCKDASYHSLTAVPGDDVANFLETH
jgi:hypothetical protein